MNIYGKFLYIWFDKFNLMIIKIMIKNKQKEQKKKIKNTKIGEENINKKKIKNKLLHPIIK